MKGNSLVPASRSRPSASAPAGRRTTPPKTNPAGAGFGGKAGGEGGGPRWGSQAAAGGHATLYRAQDKAPGVFHPLAPAVAAIHQRLKAAFDPAGIFNPGRLY